MRKLFMILVAVLMTVNMSAEINLITGNKGHLKFKGVEINGKLNTFVANLEQKGCYTGENFFGHYFVQANFAGLNMSVYPLVTSQSQTVYSVVACTSDIREKVSLTAQYNELKGLLTQKYGEGRATTIPDGYYRDVVNDLVRGNATKALLYETGQGKIYLYIHEGDGYLSAGSINIQYIDKANDQLRLKEANLDI